MSMKESLKKFYEYLGLDEKKHALYLDKKGFLRVREAKQNLGEKNMTFQINAHLGKTGELYKNINCPDCGGPMKIAELFDRVTNEPIIINFCEKCKKQIHEKEGQKIHKVGTSQEETE